MDAIGAAAGRGRIEGQAAAADRRAHDLDRPAAGRADGVAGLLDADRAAAERGKAGAEGGRDVEAVAGRAMVEVDGAAGVAGVERDRLVGASGERGRRVV